MDMTVCLVLFLDLDWRLVLKRIKLCINFNFRTNYITWTNDDTDYTSQMRLDRHRMRAAGKGGMYSIENSGSVRKVLRR